VRTIWLTIVSFQNIFWSVVDISLGRSSSLCVFFFKYKQALVASLHLILTEPDLDSDLSFLSSGTLWGCQVLVII
jgi:hypothetical protein